jgi:peptidoglycan/xylan/chitin deacetylase (PgdA/CDA1 family)
MYHVIATAPRAAPYPDLYVAPRRFRAHMAHLARDGYEVVTLQQVWDHWHGGARLPRKPVVVSFDDGSRGWYRHAYPVLRKHGWVGTMNIAVNHLNRWGITVRRVRELVAAGWELDSHSLTHPDLGLLSRRDLRREVAASRRKLRRLFGVPVNFFCYPVGVYNSAVLAELRKAGYLGATTTEDGLAVPTGPFALRRIRIIGSDDAADFGRRMNEALEITTR